VIERRGRVAWLTLDRPDRHNAFDADLIAELTRAVVDAGLDPGVRALVLAGAGRSFCAGGDLGWMRSIAAAGPGKNAQDATALGGLFDTLDRSPKPVVARVHGAARGGGVGLVAACDIPVAAAGASFALTEVRLGLAPAVISPYLVARMGAARCRELFVTGETFDAAQALRIGLVHHVAADEAALDLRIAEILAAIEAGPPGAVAACKTLAREVGRLPEAEVLGYTTELIARLRAGEEGEEGMRAFLERRRPSWQAEKP
jgi:methylglutaconyl-CoA hydratase